MKYILTILIFSLVALPALAYRPDFVRPRFIDQTPLPVPPAPPPFPEPPVDPPVIPDPPITPEPPQTITNSTDCISCSGGGTDIYMTYPERPGQFWARAGSLILPLYNFGKFVRYRFFYAIDDGTGGQWFSKGTFKRVGIW